MSDLLCWLHWSTTVSHNGSFFQCTSFYYKFHTLTNPCPSLCCVKARAHGHWFVYGGCWWPHPGPGSRRSPHWWRTHTVHCSFAMAGIRCASGWCLSPAEIKKSEETQAEVRLKDNHPHILDNFLFLKGRRFAKSKWVVINSKCTWLQHYLDTTTRGWCVVTELMAIYQPSLTSGQSCLELSPLANWLWTCQAGLA